MVLEPLDHVPADSNWYIATRTPRASWLSLRLAQLVAMACRLAGSPPWRRSSARIVAYATRSGHGWPARLDGRSAAEVVWDFLFSFRL